MTAIRSVRKRLHLFRPWSPATNEGLARTPHAAHHFPRRPYFDRHDLGSSDIPLAEEQPALAAQAGLRDRRRLGGFDGLRNTAAADRAGLARLWFHLSRRDWGGRLMSRVQTLAWWYWLVTGLLVAGALAGRPLGFAPPIALTLVHTLHFLRREDTVTAFPVQVRIGYLLWMLAGLWGPLGFFYRILLAGTAASVLIDYCLMARMVSLLSWNRRAPLTWHLVVRTFLRPPVRGSILGAV